MCVLYTGTWLVGARAVLSYKVGRCGLSWSLLIFYQLSSTDPVFPAVVGLGKDKTVKLVIAAWNSFPGRPDHRGKQVLFHILHGGSWLDSMILEIFSNLNNSMNPMILWQGNTGSHTPGDGGLLGLSGGASMICIGFWYYLNVVSLPTHSSTMGNCWFTKDLWFVSDHSKHRSCPSPTTAPLCKVQYRDPCSCPSSGLVVSTSQYFQFIL